MHAPFILESVCARVHTPAPYQNTLPPDTDVVLEDRISCVAAVMDGVWVASTLDVFPRDYTMLQMARSFSACTATSRANASIVANDAVAALSAPPPLVMHALLRTFNGYFQVVL